MTLCFPKPLNTRAYLYDINFFIKLLKVLLNHILTKYITNSKLLDKKINKIAVDNYDMKTQFLRKELL